MIREVLFLFEQEKLVKLITARKVRGDKEKFIEAKNRRSENRFSNNLPQVFYFMIKQKTNSTGLQMVFYFNVRHND